MGALGYYFLFENKIYDVRSVYSIPKKDLDTIQSSWTINHFEDTDFQAYIIPRFSSIYNQQVDSEMFYVELAIRTNNKEKLEKIQLLYLESQPMSFLEQKPQFFKTKIIQESKRWNVTIGVFILLFLIAYGVLKLSKLQLLKNKV